MLGREGKKEQVNRLDLNTLRVFKLTNIPKGISEPGVVKGRVGNTVQLQH